MSKVLVFADFSGSIPYQALDDAFIAIRNRLQSDDEIEFVAFDHEIYETQLHKAARFELKNILVRGGGGTDFNKVFKYVAERDMSPFSEIYFISDGYGHLDYKTRLSDALPTTWIKLGDNDTKWFADLFDSIIAIDI